ncbi:MAG: metallophosphoesterase [Eubacteriaceae bacterium]|nr:metallophosphoesterase [Eubacteriaceae bacterium]
MAIAFCIVMGIFTGSFFYIGRRAYQVINFRFGNINVAIYTVLYLAIALSFFLGRLPLPELPKKAISAIGSIWMGLFVYLLLLFFLADLVVAAGKIAKIATQESLPKIQYSTRLWAILLACLTTCFGLYNATQVRFVSYEIHLKNPLSKELKIAFIADLHLGDTQSENRLEKVTKLVNEAGPDLVAIVGDIFTDDYYRIKDAGKAETLIAGLDSTYGTFACLGNHDAGKTLAEMMDFLLRSNVRLLNDEIAIIEGVISIIGRLDSSPIGGFGELSRSESIQALAGSPNGLPVIVMDHNPANISQYAQGVDLVLAGHTHRGQIFPGSMFTSRMFTVDYGYYQENSSSPHIVVTSGAGTWMMPIRLGTFNEVVLITLH